MFITLPTNTVIIMDTLSRIACGESWPEFPAEKKRGKNHLMRIIAFGDIHMDPGNAANIPDIDSADLVLITGDITNYGFSSDAAAVLSRLLAVNNSILGVAGNLDQPDVARYLEDKDISLHGRGRIVDGLGIMGLGGSNHTPFNTPLEYSEQELAAFLSAGFARIKEAENFILVSHPPPMQTETDRLRDGRHVGSKAVRAFIEKRQPLLCLTGHIHESRGRDYIGRTLVLNPGMMKDGGYIEATYDNGDLAVELHP